MDPESQQIFRDGGIVRISNFVDARTAGLLAARALQLADVHAIKRDGYPSRGGRALHEILDGNVVQAHFPEVSGIYARARALAEDIVGRPVILSPYLRSGVNIRIYRQSESEDGWHFDTNPLSGLLYLTSGGQPTQFKTDDGFLDIYPSTGLFLLFDGRSLLHHVPKGGELRITCPLNLYYPDDVVRPDYIDKVLFDNSDAVRP